MKEKNSKVVGLTIGNNGDSFTLMKKTEVENVLGVREAQMLGLVDLKL